MATMTLGPNGRIFLLPYLRKEYHEAAKRMGAVWKPEYGGQWGLSFSVDDARLPDKVLKFAAELKDDLDLSDEVVAKLDEANERAAKRQHVLDLCARNATVMLKVPGLKGVMYNYQKLGVMFASANASGALIADSMGLGKTVQAIAVALLRKTRGQCQRVLVVTPASLKWNWPLEIQKWTSETWTVIDGNAEQRLAQWRKNAFFTIANYELLTEDLFGGKDFREKPDDSPKTAARKKQQAAKAATRKAALADVRERTWDMVILDEAHAIGGHSSKRTLNTKALKADYRIALTGTPLDGRLEQLHSLMGFVSPGLFPSLTRFLLRYAITNFWGQVTGYRHVDEVRSIIRPFYIRRLKHDVLAQLPDKVYLDRVVELSEEERAAYDEMADRARRSPEALEAIDPLTAITRCRQVCDLAALADQSFATIPSSKLEVLVGVLDEVVVQNGHKVLIFSQYLQMLPHIQARLDEMGLKYLVISGEVAPQRRAEMQAEFNNSTKIDAMLGTDAMSQGLNLTGANHVINYDEFWSPSVMRQREDRCVLQGQLIQTARGFIPIEDVVVGDRVLTHAGVFSRVLSVKSRLHRNNTTGGLTTEISTRRFGLPLKTTHDHRVLVARGNQVGWSMAQNVRPRDCLLSPVLSGTDRKTPNALVFPERLRFLAKQQCPLGGRSFVNGNTVHVSQEVAITDDTLFIFGWYLAEGFASVVGGKGRFVSFSGHVKERPILEKILAASRALFGVDGTIMGQASGPKKNAVELRLYSSELAVWFAELFGRICQHKSIPAEWVETWAAGDLWKIFDAYRQGGGYRRRKTTEWVTVAPTLGVQMSHIAEMNGRSVCVRRVSNKHNEGQWVCGYTDGGIPDSPLMAKRVPGFVCLPVNSVTTRIEKKKNVRVFDLEVEGFHTFVAGRAVVHNCHRIGQKDCVTVVNLYCRDTIEERVREVLKTKSIVSAEALGDDARALLKIGLTPKDLLKLL